MHEFIRCPSCNNAIGAIYKLFIKMKNIKMKTAKELKDQDCLDIFKILHITNPCCKTRLISVKIHDELLFEDYTNSNIFKHKP